MIAQTKGLKLLLFISCLAGLTAVFLFRRNLAAEAYMLQYFGFISEELIYGKLTVDAVKEIFSIPLVGLIYFDFFDLVNVMLLGILFTPVIYFTYRKWQWLGILSVLLLAGCLVFYAISNLALPLYINLHDPEKLREILSQMPRRAITGEISVFLLYALGLLITVMTKKLNLFSRYTYAFGLLTNVIGLLYFPLFFVIGEFRYLAIAAAAPFTVIWHANLAFHLNALRKKSERLAE